MALRHLLPIQPELNMDNRVVYPSPEIYLLNLVTSVCLEGCDCNLPQSLANDISEGYRTTLLVFSLWVSWLTTLILALIWAHYELFELRLKMSITRTRHRRQRLTRFVQCPVVTPAHLVESLRKSPLQRCDSSLGGRIRWKGLPMTD